MIARPALARRALACAVLAVAAAVAAPACGPETCAGGQTQVCLEDGTTCTCPRPCETFDDCAASASDPADVRYCYGGDLKLCLPPRFFTNTCRTGQACTGGLCVTTGACNLLCNHSAECASGCCAWDPASEAKNPTCTDELAGKACRP